MLCASARDYEISEPELFFAKTERDLLGAVLGGEKTPLDYFSFIYFLEFCADPLSIFYKLEES